MAQRRIIGVMGAGDNARPPDLDIARALGQALAEQGWVVLSGGREAGVMHAVSEGAKQVPGSITIGILPSAHTRPSRYVDIAIVTDMGNARNNINVLTSDVVVAVGLAGPGTVSEIALALKARKPVILLNADDATLAYFQALGQNQIYVAASPAETVTLAQNLLCAASP